MITTFTAIDDGYDNRSLVGPVTHPCEILREEFLRPLDLTQVALAAHIGVPVQRVNLG